MDPLLMRGFAEVGLIALIDEATGYQKERARDELVKILEAYISKELLPWTKKFPDEFFEQVYRLHGWSYKAGNAQRPGYVGHFINRFVYEQLPDGVLSELRQKNPPIDGRRRHKHFQFLTDHTGDPHLDRQIVAVTTTMRLSNEKSDFLSNFRKLYPQRGDQTEFEFEAPEVATKTEVELSDIIGSASTKALEVLADGGLHRAKEVAAAVYGTDNDTAINNARNLLRGMKKRGLVESPAVGLWRAAPTPSTA